jgi:hypothetical protein
MSSFLSDQQYPKDYGTKTYPVGATDSSEVLRRAEPLLTPEKLISRYLKGINLTQYTDDELKDIIILSADKAELMIDTTITPVIRKEKHPFDRSLYRSFIHIMANFGPILQINKVCIRSSNDKNIFEIPADWIESARFYQKQINIIPLTVVGATGVSQGQPTGAAGLAFIAAMNGGIDWVPSYWEIEYTTGVSIKEGQVPAIINDLIGTIAAINILGNLGPQNRNTSISISHDGISQSSSNPGPNIYQVRLAELVAERDQAVKKIRRVFYNKRFVTNI